MANPEPEIRPELAKKVRPDVIIGTGRSDYPNQVNNSLCFPFMFRGALDCGATTINEEMKLATVRALADIAEAEPSDLVAAAYGEPTPAFGVDYLIPRAFDPRLITNIPPAVAKAYDFSRFKTIVDVGGATGNMLAAILSQHAAPRGVLYDRPHVVGDAPALLKARGVEARVAIEQGDFFERVPAGGDAYLLSHIIHDWNEEQCLTILGHCRKVMPRDGRLLIVETVLPAGDTPHQGKVQDIVMLVFPGGEERTEAEYGSLLGQAGFRLSRVVPTESIVSVVEAVPV
jgi:hypothetical protein